MKSSSISVERARPVDYPVSKGAVIGVRTVELINISIVILVDGTFPKGFTGG